MRIGVDIGGTFTDGVAVDDQGRLLGHHKEPSTWPGVHEGALEAIERLRGGTPVELVAHGTTVTTNALIERKLGRTALVTTKGFRDVLAIATQMRPDLYDVMQVKPEPLVPRDLRFECDERMGADGRVVRPLDERAVARLAGRIRRERAEAVAICFLFAYANPKHERRAGDLLRQLCPGVEVALSSDVAPLIREYPRTSTVVVNAALRPLLSRYLAAMSAESGAPVLVMQSNGGVLPAAEAATQGHAMLVSGPVAGVVGANVFAAARGERDLVTMDMGGTSFDTCLVVDGLPASRGESSIGGHLVLASTVDIQTVGAGGGSLAWVDPGGALRVGPGSAGAVPGPACYGRGGTYPTVTDANLILGRLDPERFLGGRLRLDAGAAERAVHDHVARPLGVSPERAASAIVDVASATMGGALRVVTVGRGRDPARLSLVACGGAGPLHAARLADDLGAPRVLVPPLPGFISAIGLLATDLRTEVAETVLGRWSWERAPAGLGRLLARMGPAAARRLGVPKDRVGIAAAVDCRYRGQGYELTIPLPDATRAGVEDARTRFHTSHRAVYGHSAPEEPVEIVTLRVQASAPGAGFAPRPISPRPPPATEARRKVFDRDGWVEVLAFERESLPPGWNARGPLLVVEPDSTTWVPTGWSVRVDTFGTLELARA